MASKIKHLSRPALIDAFIARNRAQFGTARMTIDPAAEAAAAAAAAATKASAEAEAAAAAAGRGPGTDGNKPIAEMTDAERVDYFSRKADRLKQTLKEFGGRTPEQVAEAFEKAKKHDALELELGTASEKAAAKAAEDATKAARDEYLPELVNAKLEAAAAGRISSEALAKALEFVDTSKFLNDAGKPDTDKVKAFIDGIAPATGTTSTRRGPTATGHGSTSTSSSGGTALTGREMYDARHKKKTSA